MDVIKQLKIVTNLNQYMQVTQNVSSSLPNLRIELNMSTIEALKKTKSFEIEHFNKYEESGAAIKVFEVLFLNPPSKTWQLLGRELVLLLQYWLNALRKHLIMHNNHWWSFLQTLLQFIKELGLKDNKLYDGLIKETAECLLDLATHCKPDHNQRYKILCCLNSCGSACSRETRIALREHFNIYFIKLATFLSSCGDMAIQYSVMETLIRWLLPRYVQDVRMKAAAKWFPNHIFHQDAVTIFVERPWKDFFQDARDFLNAHNSRGDLITSVVCRKLTIGEIAVVTDLGSGRNWLDMNVSTKCLSVMLKSKALKLVGCGLATEEFEALVISESNTDTARLRKVDREVVISVRTLAPALVIPSEIQLVGERCALVNIVISTKSDMRKVDDALRKIFAEKYQVLFDIEHGVTLSPTSNSPGSRMSDEDTTFSMPSVPARRKHSGYIVKSRTIGSAHQTSTTSTTSLAQLPNKLANLPCYNYPKRREEYKICREPELEHISELSEFDVGASFGSGTGTFRFKQFGVQQDNCVQSAQALDQEGVNKLKTKCTSPLPVDEGSVSCLYVATLGTADESIISATLERVPKAKDDPGNLIDLLVQEALEAKSGEKPLDLETSREVEKPVPNEKTHESSAGKFRNFTIISNSTSTEDIVEGTQFSNTVKNKFTTKKSDMPLKNLQDKVDDFFSEHVCADKDAVSPSLARRHNETDSETSEVDCRGHVDEIIQHEDIDVEECLKFIVDTICKEIPYPDNLIDRSNVINQDAACEENNLKVTTDVKNKITGDPGDFKSPTSSRSYITLKFKNIKKKTTQNKLNINYHDKSPALDKIETIEKTNDVPVTDDKITKRSVRNKRKLYSPKNDAFDEEINEKNESQDISKVSVKTYTKRKSLITPYKDIEKDRNEYRKKLRSKQTKKSKEVYMSPKTKKMNDIFDELRSNIDTKVALADCANTSKNIAIYNFPSDSEENFKISKLKHVTPKKSNFCTISEKSRKKSTRSKNKNVKRSKPKVTFKRTPILVDERMREANIDDLNTSFEIKKQPRKVIQETLLNIKKEHEMDVIEEPKQRARRNKAASKRVKPDKKKNSPAKDKRKNLNKSIILNETLNTSQSPLPGLLVETTTKSKNAADMSTSPARLEKIKQMYVKSPEKFETTNNLFMDLDRMSECGYECDNSNILNISQSSRVLRSQTKLTPTKKVIVGKRFLPKESHKKSIKKRADIDSTRIINISGDSNSERSIKTIGVSPITAHGDFELCCDDLPPSHELLNETIEPRNLEIEEQNSSIKDLHMQLNTDILEDQSVRSWRKAFRNDVAKRRNTPDRCNTKLSDNYIRWLPSPRDSETGSDSAASLNRSNISKSSIELLNKKSRNSKNFEKKISRRTEISPIRSFNESISYQRRSSTSESDVAEEKNMFYIKRNKENVTSRRRTDSSDSISRVVKRKSCELHDVSKRRRTEEMNSDHSTSYVSTWMEKCLPDTSRGGSKEAYEDIIRNIHEKLDTTLDEIHHNTNKRLINTFVETQKKLNDLKRIQREALEEIRRDVDYKINRVQEMTDDVLAYLKADIRSVIREDSKQKRALVRILKEDVQAVIDFKNKRHSK